jgi:hypothetical protein
MKLTQGGLCHGVWDVPCLTTLMCTPMWLSTRNRWKGNPVTEETSFELILHLALEKTAEHQETFTPHGELYVGTLVTNMFVCACVLARLCLCVCVYVCMCVCDT